MADATLRRRLIYAALLAPAFALVAAFAITVWPTMYRYDHVTRDGETYPVRTHRITGRTEVLIGAYGWLHQDAKGDLVPRE
jgi:hypothetical protein